MSNARISIFTGDGRQFTDARAFDVLFYTDAQSQRLLLGNSSNAPSLMSLDQRVVTVSGHITAHGEVANTGLVVCPRGDALHLGLPSLSCRPGEGINAPCTSDVLFSSNVSTSTSNVVYPWIAQLPGIGLTAIAASNRADDLNTTLLAHSNWLAPALPAALHALSASADAVADARTALLASCNAVQVADAAQLTSASALDTSHDAMRVSASASNQSAAASTVAGAAILQSGVAKTSADASAVTLSGLSNTVMPRATYASNLAVGMFSGLSLLSVNFAAHSNVITPQSAFASNVATHASNVATYASNVAHTFCTTSDTFTRSARTLSHRCFVQASSAPLPVDHDGLVVVADTNLFASADLMGPAPAMTSTTPTIPTQEGACHPSPVVTLALQPRDRRVFGVVAASASASNRADARSLINVGGDGAVWVCDAGGTLLAAGDLLTTSAVPGYAMLQTDDWLRSYTVAKLTMGCDLTDSHPPTAPVMRWGGDSWQTELDVTQTPPIPTTHPIYDMRFIEVTPDGRSATQITRAQYESRITTSNADAARLYRAALLQCTYCCV
jgi:hypothetical protein